MKKLDKCSFINNLIQEQGVRKIRINTLWEHLQQIDSDSKSFDSQFYDSPVVAMAIRELDMYQEVYKDEFSPEDRKRLQRIKIERDQYFVEEEKRVKVAYVNKNV